MASKATGVSGIAERYATALYDLADEGKQLDAVAADLARIKSMLAGSPDLARFLKSPLIGRQAQTKGVLAVLDAAEVTSTVRRFAGVVGNHRRLYALPAMIDAFLATLARRRGEVTAHVTVAAPLSDAQGQALAAALRQTAGQKINIETKVDPGLIGGLVVRIGSRMVDTSLRSQLQRLERSLKAAG